MSLNTRDSVPPLTSLLRSLELELLTPALRKTPEALHLLLAEGFTEFGSSGHIYTRAEVLAALIAEASASGTPILTDFVVQQLSPTLALATYRSVQTYPSRESLRSSLWVFRDARWQILFHQGTPIP